MGDDFAQYEEEYIKRQTLNKKLDEKERQHQERIDSTKQAASIAVLDSWDYVVLEMIKREDLRIPMKVGTMRCNEAYLKLFCKGLISKRTRELTFDERERVQTFLDSSLYEQYKDRLRGLLTHEIDEQLKLISEIIDVKIVGWSGPSDDIFKNVWVLTDVGREKLTEKRNEVIELYKKYKENDVDFYRNIDDYSWAFPMMAIMGTNSVMMWDMRQELDALHADVGFDGYGELGFG